jgi:hypothetical protein
MRNAAHEIQDYTRRVEKSEAETEGLPQYYEARDAFIARASADKSLLNALIKHDSPAKFAYDQGMQILKKQRKA